MINYERNPFRKIDPCRQKINKIKRNDCET